MDDLASFRRHAAKQRRQIGMWDCCIFCADWFLLRRGSDPAGNLRSQCSTEADVELILRRYGGLVKLFETCLGRCGGQKINPSERQRGDIVIVDWPDKQSPGIMLGSEMVMSTGHRRGIVERSLSIGTVVACWRV